MDWCTSQLFGMPVAGSLLEEVARERPDVLVVDYQLRGALSAAEKSGAPTTAVVHTAYRFHGTVSDPEDLGPAFEAMNRTRSILGVPRSTWGRG